MFDLIMKSRIRFSSRVSRYTWRELSFTSVLSYMLVLQPIARISECPRYQLHLFRERKHGKYYAIFHARAALRYLEMYSDDPYIFKGFMYLRTIHYNDFFFHYNKLLKYIQYV